jgi:hypothetical protein
MDPIDFLPIGSYRVYGEDNKIIVRSLKGGFLNTPVSLTKEQEETMSAHACLAILGKEAGNKGQILHIETTSLGTISNRWAPYSS